MSDFKIPLNSGVFGLVDRQAMDSINALQEGNRYFPGLRAWVGYKNAIVYYDRQDRVGGDGKLSFMSRIKYAFDAIYSFSAKPLRVSVFSGLTCVAISGVMLLAMIGSNWSNWTPSTAFDVMTGLFFIGGLQMICLGAVAEYIGRIYDEVRRRPLSIINKVYRAETKEQFLDRREAEQLMRAA
jgi:polyisoprenyl-phosphate glycosyltransferase